MLYRSSAPGSLMIIGEHAVLHGYPAVAAAINKRVYVTIKKIDSKKIKISTKDQEPLELSDLSEDYDGYYKFIFASIKAVNEIEKVDFGIEVQIDSEIRDDLGFGTSAGVVVATISALLCCLDIDVSKERLFSLSRMAIMIAQSGIGSCSDVAASICGGMVRMQNYNFAELNCRPLELQVVYCGYKTKTVDVIKRIESFTKIDKDDLYQKMGFCAESFIKELQKKDLSSLGHHFVKYQSLMRELGVCDLTIDGIIVELQRCGFAYSKISGSGLGDCVISMVNNLRKTCEPRLLGNAQVVDVSLSSIGVLIGEQEAVCI